jgi:BirA family biotin operon repressor/biotin-[acetyl-CoA-carboxylase] ligase
LLQILADGEFHSGEDLGQKLGITRAAVWKRLQCLAAMDIPIQTSRARGYRIVGGMDLLEQERILSCLDPQARGLVGSFLCLAEVPSTNALLRYLHRRAANRGARAQRAAVVQSIWA